MSQCPDLDNSKALAAFGSFNYIIIAYCPIMSVFYGPGGVGKLDTATKLGGFLILGTDSPTTTALNLADF